MTKRMFIPLADTLSLKLFDGLVDLARSLHAEEHPDEPFDEAAVERACHQVAFEPTLDDLTALRDRLAEMLA